MRHLSVLMNSPAAEARLLSASLYSSKLTKHVKHGGAHVGSGRGLGLQGRVLCPFLSSKEMYKGESKADNYQTVIWSIFGNL